MAAEEDSDKVVDTPVRNNSSAATRKSNKSFAPPTKPGSSANNSTNPASSPTISLPATETSAPITKSAKCRIRKKAAQITSPASETDKPPSSSNIDTNPKSQQNHPSRKNTLGSESGKTPEAATMPPACVQPFTGFTAMQIEATRQRSIEAQNHKEAIIRLMRAKLLNKDDLAIIEPVDFDKKCKDYEGHRIGPIHYDASGHLNLAQLDNRLQIYNAVKSLPEGMLVKQSPIPGAGRGVFIGQSTTLRKDMIYGPYGGVRVYNEREARQSGYCWQIYCKRKISRWIDARQVRRSNWLRYINCAATMEQQNVCAYQVGQNIYYRTVVDIGPDTELLVWYGDDYARELGLHNMAFMASINSITINGAYLACWDCQLEFRCRQLLNQHKFTAHDSVNPNIVDVVGKTRCVTNTVPTRQVRGSGANAKSGAVAYKTPIAFSAGSALSGVVESPGGTWSSASSNEVHGSSAGTTECFGARVIDSALNKCQVTAGSGGVSSSGVQSRVDVSRVVVVTDDGRCFQCSTCCKLFETRAHLIEHTRIHTGEKPFECTTCGQRFTLNGNLTKHSCIHTGEKPFECTACGQRFTQKSDLTRHTRRHTGEKPFECTTCGQKFTMKSSITQHSRIHNGEKPFECKTCGQMFTLKGNLSRHSLVHTGEKPFECTTCGQRFTQNSNLTEHSRRHTGEKPFECKTCGQRFTQHSSLTEHSRRHTGEKPFECTTCGQRFTQHRSLTEHSRGHTGEKPFECTACGQRFTLKGNLTRHSRIHTGEKPFKCTMCGQRFTQNSNLTEHSRGHTGEKSFECTMCGQRFTLKGNLTRHSLIHTGDSNRTMCDQRFTQSIGLTKHSRSHGRKIVCI